MSHGAPNPSINPRHTALVIIDLQNDFLAPDGAYARGGAVSAAAQALPCLLYTSDAADE